MADVDSWDAESLEPGETVKKTVHDKWQGEDEDDDVKDNWDDDDGDEEEEKVEEKTTVTKPTEKMKLRDKIKEEESLQRENQEELKQPLDGSNRTERTAEEDQKLSVQKLEEDSEPEKEALGVVSNDATGIDAMSPSSKDDFTEFEHLLKEKLSPYEKSLHYCGFLESLFRDLCLSLEIDDLKKINNSLTVLLSEKQKQEKQNKGKKKKKGVLPAGGLKAKMKDDLADYGGFDGGYAQDYEDFM